MKTEVYKIELVLANFLGLSQEQILSRLQSVEGLLPSITQVQKVEVDDLPDGSSMRSESGLKSYVTSLPFSETLSKEEAHLLYAEALNRDRE